jgi:hypothetical protein
MTMGEPLPPRAPDIRALLEPMVRHGVEFVLIGGMAGIALGSNYPSFDVDILYRRGKANVARLVAALGELDVRLRGAPADVPFILDERTIENGANFTFLTRHGDFDVLAEAAGVKGYDAVALNAVEKEIHGLPIKVASIDDLIAMKRAANRPKDRNMLEEFIVLAEKRQKRDEGSR